MRKESEGNRNYDWTGQIARRLRGKPRTQWVIMRPGHTMNLNQMNFNYYDAIDIVVWNDHEKTQYYWEGSKAGKPQPDRLMSIGTKAGEMPISFAGKKYELYDLYPYAGYKGITSK